MVYERSLLEFLAETSGGSKATKLCSVCQGEHCCRHSPGAFYPDDFTEPLDESLVECFKRGLVSVDWYEYWGPSTDGDSRGLFVRPATREAAGGAVEDPTWGGICVFFSDDGCILPDGKKPTICRMLVPKLVDERPKCEMTEGYASKADYALAWAPFRDVIRAAVERAETEGINATPMLPRCTFVRTRSGMADIGEMLSGMFGLYGGYDDYEEE